MPERFSNPSEYSWQENKPKTADSLRKWSERAVDFACKSFSIEGEHNLQEAKKIQTEQPESKFIVASSHVSNLDGPAAVKALGQDFNLQMAVDSTHFGFTQQEAMYRLAGKENFTGIEYQKQKDGSKTPV